MFVMSKLLAGEYTGEVTAEATPERSSDVGDAILTFFVVTSCLAE